MHGRGEAFAKDRVVDRMSDTAIVANRLTRASVRMPRPYFLITGSHRVMNALILIRPDVEACADRARITVEIGVDARIDAVIDRGEPNCR